MYPKTTTLEVWMRDETMFVLQGSDAAGGYFRPLVLLHPVIEAKAIFTP